MCPIHVAEMLLLDHQAIGVFVNVKQTSLVILLLDVKESVNTIETVLLL